MIFFNVLTSHLRTCIACHIFYCLVFLLKGEIEYTFGLDLMLTNSYEPFDSMLKCGG